MANPGAAAREGTAPNEHIALMLGGGGARGAYQAGVLRGISRQHPDLKLDILTGISAGAVNTVFLAAHPGDLPAASDALVRLWLGLTPSQVFDVKARHLLSNTLRWAVRLVAGGHDRREPTRGLLDTGPLRHFLKRVLITDADGALPGIEWNLREGRLHAVALSATSYTTGQSVTWVEAHSAQLWQRPQRRSERSRLTVEHVLASSALPMLFPAVQIGSEWFGDGGVRLTAPLSPPLHLGACKILTIATRYPRSRAEADLPLTNGYPPPAQVLSVLYNSIFLDLIDEDILRLERINRLIEDLRPDEREGMRRVDILVLRPSRDLGKLAAEFEPRLPHMFRYLTRGLGTQRTASPDILSLLMFQEDYLRRLVELGESDAEDNAERIKAFLAKPTQL